MAIYLNKDVCDSDDYFFLSYKKENADILRQIVPNLNFNVWYDHGIQNGYYSWNEAIYTHLVESQAVIFFLSRELLKGGDKSFPFFEYNQAVADEKDIIVVFLEDIDIHRDVPNSLKFWYQRVITGQCIGVNGHCSPKELADTIQSTIDSFRQSGKSFNRSSHKRPAPKELYLKEVSGSIIKRAIYNGFIDSYFSTDMSKFAAYDYINKKYDVYDTDSTDFVITSFTDKHKEMKPTTKLLYTARDSFIYYIDNKKIHIYDVAKKSWNSLLRKNIPLSKNEYIDSVCHPLSGNYTYLIVCKDGLYTRIIKYNLVNDSPIFDWNITNLNLCSVLDYLNNTQIQHILFSNTDSELIAIDLESGKYYNSKNTPDFCNTVENYFNQPNNINRPVDEKLSHDGSLYSVNFSNGFEVIDARQGARLCSLHHGQYHNVYLLKNSVVLTFDKNGTVAHTSFDGKMEIMTNEYFTKIPQFDGNIPFQMCYDEPTGNYIFLVTSKEETEHCKIVIVDRYCRVIAYSPQMSVPKNISYCKCSITNDKIFVILSPAISEKDKDNKYYHSVIYSFDYNRKEQ